MLYSQLCPLCVSLSIGSNSFETPRTVAHQAPLSTGSFRQKSWIGLPFPSPGTLSLMSLIYVRTEWKRCQCIFQVMEPETWVKVGKSRVTDSCTQHECSMGYSCSPHNKGPLLFSLSVVSDSLLPHGLQHTRLLCPSPSPGVCSNSCPLSQSCHRTISSSVVPFSSCPQSFPT